MLELTEKGLKDRQAQITARIGEFAYRRMQAGKVFEDAEKQIALLESAGEQVRLALADLATDKTVNAAKAADTGVTEHA